VSFLMMVLLLVVPIVLRHAMHSADPAAALANLTTQDYPIDRCPTAASAAAHSYHSRASESMETGSPSKSIRTPVPDSGYVDEAFVYFRSPPSFASSAQSGDVTHASKPEPKPWGSSRKFESSALQLTRANSRTDAVAVEQICKPWLYFFSSCLNPAADGNSQLQLQL